MNAHETGGCGESLSRRYFIFSVGYLVDFSITIAPGLKRRA